MSYRAGDAVLKTGKRAAALLAGLLCILWMAGARGELTKNEEKKNGKLVRVTWMDETGAPAEGPDGYAIVTYTRGGGTTTETYFDAEGQPCEANGGYYGQAVTTDGKGRVTEIVFLDSNGRITMNNRQYARVTIAYTSFGAVRRQSYYGIDKKRTMVPSLGYAAFECEFRGKTMTKRTYLDAAGNPTDGADGYAIMIQKVNKKNQIVGIEYQHANGSPATCPDGWSRSEITLDKKGRETSVKYYSEDGRLTDRNTGYAWEETVYPSDEEERITRYDLDGKPVERAEGYVTLVRIRKNSRIVKEYFLNADGNRVPNANGAGALTYSYDQDGNITEITEEPLGNE